MNIPPNFIDLKRKFAVLKADASPDDIALGSYGGNYDWASGTTQLSWADLLKKKLVVVLGEPGSGKSYEMQAQVSSGTPDVPRFFLRLDDLAIGNDLFLSSAEGKNFKNWIKAQGRAIFFLDSVDEAKITQDADFHRALDRFASMLGRIGLARSTIIISSRITEWKPTSDGHAVQSRLLGRSHNDENLQEDFLVVSLLPLDRNGVETYVTSKRENDAQRFIEALDKSHAWEYSRRPADVDDLLAYWREKGQLGLLTEILDFICDSQLRKTSDRDRTELLSLDRATEGAECLAAATVFCRKLVFQIPGEPNTSAGALDSMACLSPDWRLEEIRALFNHAVFDGASYGHIRFHHRRLSEFLASRWIKRLMERGCPVSQLEEILFHTADGECVLRPSLAPLAAWLCPGAASWNMSIFNRVLRAAPEIFLRYGDPAALSLENRRSLLRSLANKADGRDHLWWKKEPESLSRIADSGLASDVSSMLLSPTAGSSIKELALEMVIWGRLKKCSAAVLQVAIGDLEKGEVFPDAARALVVIGSLEEMKELATAAKNVNVLRQRVGVPLSKLLFPKVYTVSELFSTVSRLKSGFRRSMGWEYSFSHHLAEVVDRSNGLNIIRGLLGHPVQDDEDDEEFECDEVPWSVKTALAVCGTMLEWQTLTQLEAEGIAEVLVRAGNWNTHNSLDQKIPELLKLHPNVRESYFNLAVERLSSEHGDNSISLSSVGIFYGKFELLSADLTWALKALNPTSSKTEQEQAIHSILDIWFATGKSPTDLRRIKQAAKNFPEIRDLLKMRTRNGILVKTKFYWHCRFRHRFYIRRKFSTVKDFYQKMRNNYNLWRYREKLRSGVYAVWLAKLAGECYDESMYQYSRVDWDKMRKMRGSRFTKVVKQGCQRVWEEYTPPFPHERLDNQGATYGALAGLAGIQIAWQSGALDFAKLSSMQAKKAMKYALNEINGFPEWFGELARSNPDEFVSVVGECLEHEWGIQSDSACLGAFLHDLCYSEASLKAMMQTELLTRLIADEPQNIEVLRHILCILTSGSQLPPDKLQTLVAQRATGMAHTDNAFPLWMAMWLQTDAIQAIPFLEARLAEVNAAPELMISICANLSNRSGYRLPLLSNPSWKSPQCMRKFLPLVYKYIRTDEDNHRESGHVYSPNSRDDAQRFRGSLLDNMVSTDEPEIPDVLRELLKEPLLVHLSDYINHLLEQNRERLSEIDPWSARDVRSFAHSFEKDPRTDADLFQIGLRQLMDIKSWVETGEDSPRKEVKPEDNESGFRDWLRRRLNEKSKDRFSVAPEWEIVGGRPDLRLVKPGAAPVSLELKVADKWTMQELLDGLEKQLIGKYLLDDKARYGIYVLALFDSDRKRQSINGEDLISNDEMQDYLTTRLSEILTNRVDIEKVEIVVINFAVPN